MKHSTIIKLKRPPFLPSALTIICIAILCSLGTWQLQRLQWKQDIISNLEAAYSNQTISELSPHSLDNQRFAYGTVSGTLLTEKALLLGPRTNDGKVGNHLIVPLHTAENITYLVNLGWTDQSLAAATSVISNLPPPVTVTGLARKPDWNSFTPNNNPALNQWYKADIEEITAAKELGHTAPYIVYAEHTNYKMDAQFPNNTRWQPKNDHATYAAFWFIMAFALMVIYGFKFVVSSED